MAVWTAAGDGVIRMPMMKDVERRVLDVRIVCRAFNHCLDRPMISLSRRQC